MRRSRFFPVILALAFLLTPTRSVNGHEVCEVYLDWELYGGTYAVEKDAIDFVRFLVGSEESAEAWINLSGVVFADATSIEVQIRLHDAELLTRDQDTGQDASILYLDPVGEGEDWQGVFLVDYLSSSEEGWQVINVPVEDFHELGTQDVYDPENDVLERIGIRFWLSQASMIDVVNLAVCSN